MTLPITSGWHHWDATWVFDGGAGILFIFLFLYTPIRRGQKRNVPFKMLTRAVNCGRTAHSWGLLVRRLCSQRNNTTCINHPSAFIVYDSEAHPLGTSRNQRSALSLPSPLAAHQRLVDGWASTPKATCTLGPATKCALPTLPSRRWLASHFVLLGQTRWWCGEGSRSELKTAPYIHDDTYSWENRSHKSHTWVWQS